MVCGAGTMGSGIAQVIADAGMQALLMDVREDFVEKGIAGIAKNLAKQAEKGKLTPEEKDKRLSLIQGTTDIGQAVEADFVIECISEIMELKKDLFKRLDAAARPGVILATNTSALSISEMAAVTKRPEKVIGMHFSNPVPVMKFVEVIKGYATAGETFLFTKKLAEDLGKVPIEVEEAPGFVLNRILIPMLNEAIYVYAEGLASAEDIDAAMKLGANHPIGPLALADLIGLDVVLFVMDTLHREFADSKYRPCPLLRKMVRAGYLGRKTGRGFHTY
ncbi:MAG: 3-hydroxybutyryl-CoA dehydrogenase [Clostridia bacterium]|jgi:3-hydroxybutyryl-CoA dehydrogenase|nr:3-hydroxybutyryl-CoA dehydrogenase [Clostridia bacterium]